MSRVGVRARIVTCRWISSWLKVGSWWTTKSTSSSSPTATMTVSSTSSGKYPHASISARSSRPVDPNLMLIILPRSADNRGSPDAAARGTRHPQGPPSNPQEPTDAVSAGTHVHVRCSVALRRFLAPVASGADRWRRTSLRGFPAAEPGDRAQKLERPGEGVAAVSSRRNEGLSAQDRYPPKPGDTWSERQGGYLR